MALTRPLLDQINTNKADISDNIVSVNSGASNIGNDIGFIFNRDGGISDNVTITWKESSNVVVFGYTTDSGEYVTQDVNITGNVGIDVGYIMMNNVSVSIDSVTKKIASKWSRSHWWRWWLC